jgi:hypothetical protein
MAEATIEQLQRQIAELQAKLAAVQATSVSGEGAVVVGSVEVRDGHFIGRDLIETLNQIIINGEDPTEAQSVVAAYLQALAFDLAGLKLGEIDDATDPTKNQPLQLNDVYVPLNTTLHIPEDMGLPAFLGGGRWAAERESMAPKTRPVSALEALAQHRKLTVLGKPGSGKSTFGHSVLLALAQAWLGHDGELQRLGEGWRFGPLLPVRMILRRFAEQLPTEGKPGRAGDLWAFIGRDLQDRGAGLSSKTLDYLQRLARDHGALILLDGLDECGDASRRKRVLAAVQELIAHAGDRCRFIVTARPYAWPAGADPKQGVYTLADLDDGQIEHFIQAWYAASAKQGWYTPGEAERKRQDLLKAWRRQDLQALARNPLLLTLMATLHSNKGRLPEDRADLYHESVELLLLRWNRQIGLDKALLDELAQPGVNQHGKLTRDPGKTALNFFHP